jgi:hypothetical protein
MSRRIEIYHTISSGSSLSQLKYLINEDISTITLKRYTIPSNNIVPSFVYHNWLALKTIYRNINPGNLTELFNLDLIKNILFFNYNYYYIYNRKSLLTVISKRFIEEFLNANRGINNYDISPNLCALKNYSNIIISDKCIVDINKNLILVSYGINIKNINTTYQDWFYSDKISLIINPIILTEEYSFLHKILLKYLINDYDIVSSIDSIIYQDINKNIISNNSEEINDIEQYLKQQKIEKISRYFNQVRGEDFTTNYFNIQETTIAITETYDTIFIIEESAPPVNNIVNSANTSTLDEFLDGITIPDEIVPLNTTYEYLNDYREVESEPPPF